MLSAEPRSGERDKLIETSTIQFCVTSFCEYRYAGCLCLVSLSPYSRSGCENKMQTRKETRVEEEAEEEERRKKNVCDTELAEKNLRISSRQHGRHVRIIAVLSSTQTAPTIIIRTNMETLAQDKPLAADKNERSRYHHHRICCVVKSDRQSPDTSSSGESLI